jgi:outer membrane receptor protein involved in Fe transport
MKPTQQFKRSALTTAVTTALIASTQVSLALAQEQATAGDATENLLLEEVIVTATARAESTQNIPYNISAISGGDIEEQNIVDSYELMRNIAGISVVDRGYRNQGHMNSIVIRGVNVDNGVNGDVGLSAVSTVATYVDNTPIFANFLLKDVERVEVLRGPQGTLYGSGALGGAVRYIMKKPDATGFDAQARGSYGKTDGSSGNNLSADVMLNFPIGANAAFRVSGGIIDNDGVIDYVNLYQLGSNGKPVVLDDGGQCVDNNSASLSPEEVAFNNSCYTSRKDADTVEITHLRASFLWDATDDLRFQLTYQMQDDEIGGRRSTTKGADYYGNVYGDDDNGSTFLEPSERDVELLNLDIGWDLGFATLTSNTSSYEHNGSGWRDNTSLWVTDRSQDSTFTNWFEILYTGNPRAAAYVTAGFEEEAFVQEFRLVSNTAEDSKIDWIIGAYYMDQDRSTNNFSYLLGLNEYGKACPELGEACRAFGDWWAGGYDLSEIDFWYDRRETFTDLALYGEMTFHVSDTFRINAGLRWFDNELTNSTAMDFPLFEGVVVPYVDYPSQEESDVLLKLNLSWDIADDKMLYATYSEGFRRGGANAIPTSGFFAELNPETVQFYKADTVDNYELGIKGMTERWRYSADIFYVDWHDPQLNTATAWWGFFMAQNGDSAATKGVELEAAWAATDNLLVNFGYSYINAELTADLYAPQTGSLLSENGHRLPGTSEHVATVSLDHGFNLSNGWTLASRLHAYYQSDSINSVQDTTIQDTFGSFTLFNASVAILTDHWTFSLYGKNLGNEEGITGSYPEAYMSTDTGPFENYYGNNQRNYISTPRTFGISATYRFR